MEFSDLLKNLNENKVDINQYKELANVQNPIAMLITCVDSRIMPEELLGLKPGQIFCLRNIGGLVPEYGKDDATESAIEYAVNHLNIKNIVVMGHSNCGGISALVNQAGENSIRRWLEPWSNSAKKWLKHSKSEHHCQQQATLESVQNIRNMAFISKDINIYAWHFDIESTKICQHDADNNSFLPI